MRLGARRRSCSAPRPRPRPRPGRVKARTHHRCVHAPLLDPDRDRDPDPDHDHDRDPDRDPDPDHDHDHDPDPDHDRDRDRDRDQAESYPPRSIAAVMLQSLLRQLVLPWPYVNQAPHRDEESPVDLLELLESPFRERLREAPGIRSPSPLIEADEVLVRTDNPSDVRHRDSANQHGVALFENPEIVHFILRLLLIW
jgi:hypothetical protein